MVEKSRWGRYVQIKGRVHEVWGWVGEAVMMRRRVQKWRARLLGQGQERATEEEKRVAERV